MTVKPSESFSISSGKASVVDFNIDGNNIATLKDEEHKFLGRLLFFSGKSQEAFEHIRDIFKESGAQSGMNPNCGYIPITYCHQNDFF